jgi:hypothetical protein
MRFYAMHWERRYRALDVPPQKVYLENLGDPEWCRHVRELAGEPRRALQVRGRQWRDFAQFGRVSGPKFVRYWYQRMKGTAVQ